MDEYYYADISQPGTSTPRKIDEAPHISTFFPPNMPLVLVPLSESDFDCTSSSNNFTELKNVDSKMQGELDSVDQDKSQDSEIVCENSGKSEDLNSPAKKMLMSHELKKITKSNRKFPIWWFRDVKNDNIVEMKKDNFNKSHITLKCTNTSCSATIKNTVYKT